MRRPFSSRLLLFGVSVLSVSAAALNYIVQHGDSLSKITAKKLGAPIYGSKGNLTKLLSWNPRIKNPDAIFPGMLVELDGMSSRFVKSEAPARVSTALASGEARRGLASELLSEVDPSPAEDTFIKVGGWGFEAELGSTRVVSNDSETGGTAEIVSSSNLGLGVFWSQNWGDHLKTILGAGLRRLELKAPDGVTLSDAKPIPYRVALQMKWQLRDRLSLSGGFFFDQEINMSGYDSSTVGVDLVKVPKVKLGASYDVARIGPYVWGLNAEAQLFFAAKAVGYSTTRSAAYGVGTFLVLPLQKQALRAFVNFESKDIHTVRTAQTESTLVFGFGMSFPVMIPRGQLRDGNARSYDY